MSAESPETQGMEIAREILRYLQAHPNAKDTVEGIAQWWLSHEWADQRVADIEQAVRLLLSRELILEIRIGTQPSYYHVNRLKHQEIYRLLAND